MQNIRISKLQASVEVLRIRISERGAYESVLKIQKQKQKSLPAYSEKQLRLVPLDVWGSFQLSEDSLH